MVNRGGEVGFAQYDSTKTVGGQEITTYDSLDHSLAQTRNNVYMAVKSWATYHALALMFRDLGDKTTQEKCRKLAEKVAGVVAEQAVDGVLPGDLREGQPRLRLADPAGDRGLHVPALLREDGLAAADARAGVRRRRPRSGCTTC